MVALSLWVGVCLGIGAASSASLGQTLQHLSKLRAEKLEVKPPPWRRPIWYAGQGLYTIANWLDIASLVYAPMSVIIVIYALRLPMVALMASVMLNATVTSRCVLGIGIIAAAAGVSMTFAPRDKSAPFSDPADFFTPPIVFYLVTSVYVWIVVGYNFWKESRPNAPRTSDDLLRALRIPLLTAWVMTVGHLFNAGLGRLEDGTNWFQVRWVWLPIMTACLSFAGGLFNLVGVENQCTHIFVPTVFGFQAFLMGLQGALFGEFQQLSPLQMVCWCLGMVGTIVGTVLVSSAGVSEQKRLADANGLAVELSSIH